MKKIIITSLLFTIFTNNVSLAQQKPNIVIIVSDDHAYQAIGAYGSKIAKTPNIDRIAKEGVTFNKGYVTNSICGPSRAVILTGKYSHKNGFKDNISYQFDGSQDHFVKQLQKVGYQTAWIGKWHLESTPQGFNYHKILKGQGHYYNPEFLNMDGKLERINGYVSNVIEDEVEKYLDSRDKSQPFCVVIGHKATHRTWLPDTRDMGLYDNVSFPLPKHFYDHYMNREAAKVQDMSIDKTMLMGYDLKMLSYSKNGEPSVNRMTPEQRGKFDAYYQPIEADLKARNLSGKKLIEWKYQRYMRDYLSTAASLDRNIGRTLDYLEKNNLSKNTIVIYLSDQGFYLGEHGWFDKRFMYEESFRTPLVMRYPGVIKPGTKSDDLVLNMDIAPTVLDAAGVDIPKDIQGESFLPLVTGQKAQGRSAIYYHYYENSEHSVSPHFGVKNKRYKLIRFYTRVNSWELYDLQKDPHEVDNVFGKKGYEKVTASLMNELKNQMEKYDDADAIKIFSTQLGK
ncbi:sulfatase family protein [Pedobacter insulae]|uniref:Arylsulfatase A n=1 Tax=Pedobacter insulae TaxID=414048 RepID=A0A1I2WGW0_9SPHI|nr:sulfatase [Pedobacter insulae]SFH00580.1 Arylsulfatase A [Pedobacter insulae]